MLQSLPNDLPSSYSGIPFTLPTDSIHIIALTSG